jgi:hypothetical protein
MKQVVCVLVLLTLARAGDQKLIQFEDKAYGSKGWKLADVPKTRDHERFFGAAQWIMRPVIVQPISGSAKIYMRVQISAASNSLMPDAVDLRIDDSTTTIAPLRTTRDDFWVDAHNYGRTSVEFAINDRSIIERIAKSKDSWMIGYRRYGNHVRRSVEIPASWKQALVLILSKYDELTAGIPTGGDPNR